MKQCTGWVVEEMYPGNAARRRHKIARNNPKYPHNILPSSAETIEWVSLSHASIPQTGVCWDSQAVVTVPEWLCAVQAQAGDLFLSGKIFQSRWA